MRYRISYVMDEIWERAVETALDGQTDHATVRNLTLDGAVKCVHGRLPPPSIFEKFQNLLHLSIANIGVSTLEQFPRLASLQKLVLSDNRISSGLEFLVDAGLESLRDLDLSNNRIQLIEDLAPLAQLRIVSLDLYECPVTRVKDYRSRVFGLIKSLRYLDKMDAEGIERLESDDEEEDDEEEEEDEEDDPGSGEIDGEDHPMVNGHAGERDEVVDVDEDEESDADEEETEISRNGLDLNHQVNGFHVIDVQDEDEDEDDGEYEVDNESGEEEIDEEDGDDEAVVEVHEIDDSDEDVVAEDEDGDDSEEEVDNEDGDFAEPESTGRLTSTEGEIDGHEQGEDDAEEDDNGETGEEELALNDDDDDEEEEVEEEDEEDFDGGYLVQPVVHAEEDADGSDMDPGNEEVDLEEDLDEEDDLVEDEDDDPLGAIELQAPSSSHLKRKRGENVSDDDIDIDDDSSDSDSGSDEDGNDGDEGGKEEEEEDDDDDVL